MLTHTKVMHKCDICKKKFSHKSSLNRHIRINNGDRYFGCDIREKYFQTDQIEKYIRIFINKNINKAGHTLKF